MTGGLRSERVEELLILLLGSNHKQYSEAAVRLLNAYYDECNWQVSIPFSCSVSKVGGKFEINFLIEFVEEVDRFVFIVKGPDFEGVPRFSWHIPTLREYKSINTTNGRFLWTSLSLGRFERAGFYDWKLVTLTNSGAFRGVTEIVDIKKFRSSLLMTNQTE